MNFPGNQKTGSLAELRVEQLFISWSWSVGRDRIDVGYDLFVEPDSSRFGGLRFQVQVKGTVRQEKGSPTATVSKANLRKYAANRIPVFIIRAGATGVLHWFHVQPWTIQNLGRLKGNGNATIKLPRDQTLDSPEAFLSYLDSILAPPSERIGGLAETARERSEFLATLDVRLAIRVGLEDGTETYELTAKQEPVSVDLALKLKEEESRAELNEALFFGLPTTVVVDSFRLNGSEVFAAIGIASERPGIVSLAPKSRETVIQASAGTRYSMLSTEICLSAELFRGQSGFAISNKRMPGLVDFQLRGVQSAAGGGTARVDFGLRGDRIASKPLREHTELAALGSWAEDVLKERSLFLRASFVGGHLAMPAGADSMESMKSFLYVAAILGRLHKISRALGSSLTVDESFQLSQTEVSEIHLLHSILSGHRRSVGIASMEIHTHLPISPESLQGQTIIRSDKSFYASGQLIGTVQVVIELEGYRCEPTADPLKSRLRPGDGGRAVLYLDEEFGKAPGAAD